MSATGATPLASPGGPGTGLDVCRRLDASIGGVVRGQRTAIRKLLAAFASGGHVLIEDYPGTGKTTLAKALARSVGARFTRAQFTPDLLPSDILGVSIFDPRDQAFHFHPGPVFTQILLADEVNRASPRTQSALLEAMAESQITIDGVTRPLDPLFFVMATQNPVELRGTYPLPEAQMDRFALRFGLGYVTPEDEVSIVAAQGAGHPLDRVTPCATPDDILALRQQAGEIPISAEIRRYAVDLVRATRAAPGVQLGASPRASLALVKAAQALALVDGARFVTPDHVQELAVAALAHRLVIDSQARFGGATAEDVVEEILKSVPAPA